MVMPRPGLRAGAALAGGALALHQFRYRLGFGDAADHELAAHGHGYLSVVAPVVALLAALAAGQLLAMLVRAGRGDREARRPTPFLRLWLAAGAALFLTYAVQELAEGTLAEGHPSGVSAVLGGGGWWALPLALALGLLLALVLRAADAAVAFAARRQRSAHPAPVVPPPSPRPAPVDLPMLGLLACNLAGRAPPRTSG